MKKLAGKVAIITGGSSGIGLEAAKLFAGEGAKVFITGRRQNELDDAVKQIGRDAIGVQGDVSKLEDLDRLYARVQQENARIDVLFANAGGGEFAPLGSITEEHFDKIFDTNVKGLLFSVQKALPLFQDGGSIILNASVAGSKGIEAFSVYSATKAAVRSFACACTIDLKPRGIRVNVIRPGPIDTQILNNAVATKEELNQLKTTLASRLPMGRIGRPEEVPKAAFFLASADSSFVTGVELFVDGGMAQV